MIHFLVNIHWCFIYQYNTFISIWGWYSILTQCIGHSTLHKTLLIALENNKIWHSLFHSFETKGIAQRWLLVEQSVWQIIVYFFFIFPSKSVHSEKSPTTLFNIWTQKMIAREVEHSCLCKKTPKTN